jgi:probable rRNA maturation factor
MPIEVFVADEQSDAAVDIARWSALAEQVLISQGISANAELSVLYVDEESIASLNKRFLGHDGPTDVLSFPIEDDLGAAGVSRPGAGVPVGTGPGRQAFEDGEDFAQAGSGAPGDAPLLLGDVVICPRVAARNAPAHAGTYDDEMALLLVHGILHLLGMDHEVEAEAEAMETKERELLSAHHHGHSLGIAQ